MDLLFKEYASPFLILDGMISCGEFENFILFFIEKTEERKWWDFYVNKLTPWNEMTWEEFKEKIRRPAVAPAQKVETEKIPEIINASRNILSGFREGTHGFI